MPTLIRCARTPILLGVALIVYVMPLPAQDRWRQDAERDLRFMHAHIASTHPGAVNPDDPDFTRRSDTALALGLSQATTVRTEGGYYWTLRRFLAAFDDLHVGIAQFREPDAIRWPGFEIDAAFRVTASSDAAMPPVGATLRDCDGVPADSLVAARIGTAVGRWPMRGQQLRWTSRLFATSDPTLPELGTCRFDVGGTPTEFRLIWRDGRLADLHLSRQGGINQSAGSIRRNASLSRVGPDVHWVALPTFRDVPGSPENAALESVIAELSRVVSSTAPEAPIVLDVRGNGGGSDLSAHRLATVIWGRTRTELARERADYALRASPSAIAELEETLADEGLSASERRETEQSLARLRSARQRGETLVRFRETRAPTTASDASGRAPTVYVLTDATCFSACLSAMDLWLALGAIHVGQETAADTRYLEVRFVPLPSGHGRFFSPTAILYRARGDNVPFVPTERFDGDIADDAAVRAWMEERFFRGFREEFKGSLH